MAENRSSSGDPAGRARRLAELARLFLKLGTLGFGGPAAHIAMMEEEVVRQRGWLSHGAVALVDGFTLVSALLSAVLLFRFNWNSAWLLALGALGGWIFFRG